MTELTKGYQVDYLPRRDLALFEVALSTMMRASDVLALRLRHVTNHYGDIVEDFYWKQRKTDGTVKCFLSDNARVALKTYIDARYVGGGGHVDPDLRLFPIERREYSDVVKHWAKLAHLDPRGYSTHSMRRTSAAHIYRMTKNLEAVRHLLGHSSLSQTQFYLGIAKDDAIEVMKEHAL